ncbi:reverse transcriptase-like protein [Alkalihalobacillus sp. AL-G]|uniref:reverse transcriptase-like protein n=1 Tax=Alkalihalobacillus sp. AL-G TaxID=2926399 RepID=UPI00272D4130|nr:reverse transcriptase-like protein [Alkalihalobacillus sp. AL-G]WLD91518.1 reverse transcriptase-like protein [Alkalihalobacillus sp. AL-G]
MIEIYIDGASSGNPGPSGAGIFIKGLSTGPETYSVPIGIMTNHEAEYLALIHGLTICIEKGYKVVSFRTDSQLVEQAVEKEYVKKNLYQPLLQQVLFLKDELDLFFIKWIPSSQNKNADELARKAIQMNR